MKIQLGNPWAFSFHGYGYVLMIDIFIFYFPPQLTGGFWSPTLKEICLFSKTPPIQLLDTPPWSELQLAISLVKIWSSKATIIRTNQIIAVHSLQLCKHGGVSSNCMKCDFAKWVDWQWHREHWPSIICGGKYLMTLSISRMYSWVSRLINDNDFHQKLFEQLNRVRPSILTES